MKIKKEFFWIICVTVIVPGAVVWFLWMLNAVFENAYPRSTFNDEGSTAYSVRVRVDDVRVDELGNHEHAVQRVQCKHNGVGGRPLQQFAGFLYLDAVKNKDGSLTGTYESQKWQLLGPNGYYVFLQHIAVFECVPDVAEVSVLVYRRTAEQWVIVDTVLIPPSSDGWYRATFGGYEQQPVYIPVSSPQQ